MAQSTHISISTKTGDRGETGLANGQRLAKDAGVFEVVGTLDELNSWLGVVLTQYEPLHTTSLHKSTNAELIAHLYHVQHTLFYIGAEVAGARSTELAENELAQLERWSDSLQQQMSENWTTQFLLPGGTQLGAWLDVTRTVCRRCERVLVGYSREVAVRPIILQYLNRLSDYLYIMRCYVNQELSYTERPFSVKKPGSR